MSKEEESHECNLPPQEDVLVMFIHEGYMVMTRRKIKKFFMINEHGKRTRDCFKSSFLIEREKYYHLRHHYYMIHPFSRAKEYYDVLVTIILFISILTLRVDNTFWYDNICNLLLLLDILRTFITGKYREALNDTVLNPGKVAWIYLKGWFIIDFLTVVPNYIQMVHLKFAGQKYLFFLAYLFEFSRIIKYFRMITLIKEHRRYGILIFKPVRLLSVVIMVIIWLSYALYLLASYKSEPFLINEMDEYFNVVWRSFSIFFLLGVIGKAAENIWVISIEIILMNLGYVFYLYLTIEFVQLIYIHLAATNKSQSMKARIHLFADYKKLPESLKYNLLQSFEFTFHKTYFNEDLILNTITGDLKREVMEFYAKSFAIKLNIFNLIPVNRMATIMTKMKVKLYHDGENIYKHSERHPFLQCLYIGTGAVYTKHGKELKHLHDGDYFGYERNDQGVHQIVTAVEICKVYEITFQQLRQELRDMPGIYISIVKVASTNLKQTYEESLSNK